MVSKETLASLAGVAACATRATRALNVTSRGICDKPIVVTQTMAITDADAQIANERLRIGDNRSSRSTLSRSIGVVVDDPGASIGAPPR